MQAFPYAIMPWLHYMDEKVAHAPASSRSHAFGEAMGRMMSWAAGIAPVLVILWIIGLGPLFILCLIFEQTKGMFHRWLMYGIGTLFSMAVLNLVTSIVLKLSLGVAAGMWTTGLLQRVFTGNVEGLSHLALEQGGLGMILTLLIVTVPPMAASFFQGTLGNFMTFSQFGGYHQGHGGLGPQGQLPGQYAPPQSGGQTRPGDQAGSNAFTNPNAGTRGTIVANPSSGDVVKPAPSNWATQTFFNR